MSAFANCASLTNIDIGNGVTRIGKSAFDYCRNLASITIPGAVTNISETAFEYCTGLAAITVDPNNQAYSSLAGVLFDKNQTTLVRRPEGKAGADYTIPVPTLAWAQMGSDSPSQEPTTL